MCLFRHDDYCIDTKDREALRSIHKDTTFVVQYMDDLHNHVSNCIRSDKNLARLDRGRPNGLLHGGNHFHDAPHNRTPPIECCPMGDIMAQVKILNLVRPVPTL